MEHVLSVCFTLVFGNKSLFLGVLVSEICKKYMAWGGWFRLFFRYKSLFPEKKSLLQPSCRKII